MYSTSLLEQCFKLQAEKIGNIVLFSFNFWVLKDILLFVGFGSVMPYIQPLMVLFFLAERCRQDEHFCREKHGAGWERYSQRVKYRMIPYVY